MKTKLIEFNSNRENINLIKETIQSGELIAFPTETVYGLGADGLNEEAVKKIFQVKGRPQDNPLILHIENMEMLKELVEGDLSKAKDLIDKFWPGPLTLVLKKSKIVPEIITAGLDTVAIRMPNNEIALEIIKISNRPIAAPSANISGRPSPTDAKTCMEDLEGKIPLIIDGGNTLVGLESTVLDITEEVPTILRPGAITLEDIQEILPNVVVDKGILKSGEKPKSPGQKYKHYAPKAEAYLISGSSDEEKESKIYEFLKKNKEKKVSLMVTSELYNKIDNLNLEIIDLGSRDNLEKIASEIFRSLRTLDKNCVDVILCEEITKEGIGLAIMNRLEKSTQNRHI